MAAKAQVENAIKYFDENGEEKSKKQTEATKIADNTTTTLDNKWYYVSDEITFDGAISVSGDVHLILCDGATLTAKEGIVVNSGNSLTIYGQSNGDNTGKLVATGNNGSAGIGSQMYYTSGTITINGGNIGATGSEDTYGYTSAGIGGAAAAKYSLTAAISPPPASVRMMVGPVSSSSVVRQLLTPRLC